MRSRSGHRREKLLVLLVVLTVTGSVLAVGAIHPESMVVLAPMVTVAAFIALARKSIFSWPAPTLIALTLAGYTLLQAIPLPRAVVELLSPASAEVWRGALQSIDHGVHWASLSLDRGASILEALKWFCYAGVFAAAAKIGGSKGSSFGAELVFSSAVIVAVVALVHWVIDAEALFGIYTPRFATPRPGMNPLLNSNNFAGYMNLGGFCGLGLLGARETRFPRPVIAALAALVFASGAMVGSRAAWAALLIGFSILLLAIHRARFESKATIGTLALVQALAAGGGILLFLYLSNGSWRALFGEGWEKIWLFGWSLPMIVDNFWFGVGRGSFETAFPAYQGESLRLLYHMVENFVLQWCAEWGVPVTLAALLAFGWTLRPSQLGAKDSPVAVGCLIGVAVLLLQNLFDLALEVPAVSLTLFALCGVLFGSRSRRARNVRVTEERKLGKAPYSPAIALVAVGIALTAATWSAGRSTAMRDRDRIATALRDGRRQSQANLTAVAGTIAGAILRHPADPYLFLSRAWLATLAHENALPWIARAIERSPMSGAPYFLLARTLLERGARDQALHALSMAVARDPYYTAGSAQLALMASHDYAVLMRAVPDGKPGAALLATFAALLKADKDPKLRSQLLEEAIRRDPTATEIIFARAEELMSALERRESPCDVEGHHCLDRIQKLTALGERTQQSTDRPLVLRARALLLAGRTAEAERSLAASCPSFATGANCSTWRVIAAEKLEDPSAIRDAIDAYLAATCGNSAGCDNAASWLGSRLEARRDWASALRVYEYVATRGGSPSTWRRVAVLASRMGLLGHARRAANQFVAGGGEMDAELTAAVRAAPATQ